MVSIVSLGTLAWTLYLLALALAPICAFDFAPRRAFWPVAALAVLTLRATNDLPTAALTAAALALLTVGTAFLVAPCLCRQLLDARRPRQ